MVLTLLPYIAIINCDNENLTNSIVPFRNHRQSARPRKATGLQRMVAFGLGPHRGGSPGRTARHPRPTNGPHARPSLGHSGPVGRSVGTADSTAGTTRPNRSPAGDHHGGTVSTGFVVGVTTIATVVIIIVITVILISMYPLHQKFRQQQP